MFGAPEALFDATPGPRLVPRHHAAEPRRPKRRNDAHAPCNARGRPLFMAGFFRPKFCDETRDVDYHIAMGGRAANTGRNVSAACADGHSAQPAELACKFQRLVDALNEVSEMAHRHDHRDVLRQYEIWLKTGSPRAHGILAALASTTPCRRPRAELRHRPCHCGKCNRSPGCMTRQSTHVHDYLITDAAHGSAAGQRPTTTDRRAVADSGNR
jgi:hypothetical protein